MLQYIINTSAIWLLSLIVFDLFLSKESFHGYNRLYLLGTFILGILLPLWQWPHAAQAYPVVAQFSDPVVLRSATVQHSIVNASVATTSINWQSIMMYIYFIGVVITTLLLVKEVLQLVHAYNKGKRSKDGVWQIIETGKAHTPYSAFRVIFICSKDNYTPEQLRIVLTHEEQHGHLLHFIDILLMQLAKIICWFHPLVYTYHSRLCIVHEYQADAAVDKEPKEYGTFLIEQAILKSAPALSHSFNRSPIKKRILMLTINSSALAKSKKLLALPLVMVCMLCCTKNTVTDNNRIVNGNNITYKGNKIELGAYRPDTLAYVDPKTNESSSVIMIPENNRQIPVTLNGEKIYDMGDIDRVAAADHTTSTYSAPVTYNELNVYLLANMKTELQSLKDGSYHLLLSDVVLNADGKIVYYNPGGVGNFGTGENTVSQSSQTKFIKTISSLLDNAPSYAAAMAKNKHVPFLIRDYASHSFTIKQGKVVAIIN